MPLRLAPTKLLRYAGLFTWACVGIPMVSTPWYFDESSGLGRGDQLAWRLCYFGFGLCYWYLTRRLGERHRRRRDLLVLALLTLCAIGVSLFSDSGLGSILLMVVSGALPWQLPLRIGLAWMTVQHLALIPVFAGQPDFHLFDAILQASLYVGFSSFVFVTSLVARQQAEAREEQRRLNAELRATRALLAESSRLTERMRIARELHDLLGHHLTALSLNLEVAAHRSEGRAQEHVRQAQSLAKLLLNDVRDAVSRLREDDALDLEAALRQLVDGVPGLSITLEVTPGLAIEDPARAHIVLRCAQEAITNTVRHSGASRLYLSVQEGAAGEIVVLARDNGRGDDGAAPGNGLRGMRERLAQYGGSLDIDTAPGRGFTLRAHLPLAVAPVSGGR
ncbi:MAG: sensor histidine kinase [Lysobacteraceae bacterium]